jgi:hypothetical protein
LGRVGNWDLPIRSSEKEASEDRISSSKTERIRKSHHTSTKRPGCCCRLPCLPHLYTPPLYEHYATNLPSTATAILLIDIIHPPPTTWLSYLSYLPTSTPSVSAPPSTHHPASAHHQSTATQDHQKQQAASHIVSSTRSPVFFLFLLALPPSGLGLKLSL